jgi:hypothetical protein
LQPIMGHVNYSRAIHPPVAGGRPYHNRWLDNETVGISFQPRNRPESLPETGAFRTYWRTVQNS